MRKLEIGGYQTTEGGGGGLKRGSIRDNGAGGRNPAAQGAEGG